MRFDRPYEELPSALLAGRLQGFSLPDLLWALCRNAATGVLRLRRADVERAVYVEEGRIVFASSSDPDDRLGEQFLRRGVITIDQLEAAISRLAMGKRLGTLLVEAGHLDAERLVNGVLEQVEGIVLDLFEWEDGEYRFERGPLPTEELIKLNMRTGELLLRGIRQLRGFSRIRRSVGALQKTYGVTEGWQALLEGVTLKPAEQTLVERLAERESTIDELCREVFLSNFEIYQTMWALRVLGVVEEQEQPFVVPSEVIQRGSTAQVDFSELLVRLARAEGTGVLYVTQEQHERSFHIADGRCVFATSNDPDDGLMAYLLRRGVISLRDREETAKRLLSNKRVGTILRELGVIDDRDLTQLVREQLSEIVYDTFRWTDAQYAFVPGPLPSVEEITLEEDLDALVARGIRRIGSWSRVWQGCGGLDVTLELKPSYLSVLDAMGAGPEEWEVIAALKTRRTPRQICRSLRFGDYRVCQILWAMRVLGGVEAVEAEEPAEVAAPAAHTRDHSPVSGRGPLVAESNEQRPLPEDRALEQSIVSLSESLEDDAAPLVAWRKPMLDTDHPPLDAPANDPASVADDAVAASTQVVPPELVEAALRDSHAAMADQDEAEVDTDAEEHRGSPQSTQVIPRELVEAAVSAPEEPRPAELPPAFETAITGEFDTVEESAEPAAMPVVVDEWEAPEDLDPAIARFNAAQRMVYRTVRAEIGAGAVNLIRSCCAQAAERDAVAGVELHTDGSWDTTGLREAVRTMRVDDPWLRYQKLIDHQIGALRHVVGDARAVELQRQVEFVERTDAAQR